MKWLVCFLFLFLYSCGQDPARPREFDGSNAPNMQTQGSAAKSCGCTSQLDPVCSQEGLQFVNACVANCYGVNYRMGACPGGTESFCNANSGFVCAQPPMANCIEGEDCNHALQAPRAFSNECVMMQAGASLIHMGLCD
jgi:hypothetical protein